jgi:tRNA(Met) C34 N-acetyltransferase TmcA
VIWNTFEYAVNLSIFIFLLQILDLVPILADQYFKEKLPVDLSGLQASVLLCIGLQRQTISYVEVCLLTYKFA